MAEELKVERNQNYVMFSLNRPEKRNAINRAVIEALDGALASIEADSSVRALVIRGEGRAFCSGLDLRDIEQMGAGGLTFEKIITRLQKLPVPTIAAVHGDALTGGLVLALTCDLGLLGKVRGWA